MIKQERKDNVRNKEIKLSTGHIPLSVEFGFQNNFPNEFLDVLQVCWHLQKFLGMMNTERMDIPMVLALY